MRLVSVVVPLWLIAIDERVGHVRREPEARQLGREHRLDRDRRATGRARAAARPTRLWPATAAVPWPITSTRRNSPGPQPRAQRRRTASRAASSTTGPPSRSVILPRSVLRNDAGASEISFRR